MKLLLFVTFSILVISLPVFAGDFIDDQGGIKAPRGLYTQSGDDMGESSKFIYSGPEKFRSKVPPLYNFYYIDEDDRSGADVAIDNHDWLNDLRSEHIVNMGRQPLTEKTFPEGIQWGDKPKLKDLSGGSSGGSILKTLPRSGGSGKRAGEKEISPEMMSMIIHYPMYVKWLVEEGFNGEADKKQAGRNRQVPSFDEYMSLYGFDTLNLNVRESEIVDDERGQSKKPDFSIAPLKSDKINRLSEQYGGISNAVRAIDTITEVRKVLVEHLGLNEDPLLSDRIIGDLGADELDVTEILLELEESQAVQINELDESGAVFTRLRVYDLVRMILGEEVLISIEDQ